MFDPEFVRPWQPGGHFEDGDDLEGANRQAGHSGGVEHEECRDAQVARRGRRLPDEEEDADGGQAQETKYEEGHLAAGGLDHGGVVVAGKQNQCAAAQ